MKKILLLTFTFCFSSFTFSQQYGWKDISSTIPDFPNDTVYIGEIMAIASFTDVFFIDDNEGWITVWDYSSNNMDSATILHTADGGESWEVQIVPSICNTIWMLNKNVGYAGSQDGRIYKTIDSGNNWLFHSIPAGPVTDISFPPNSETGYAMVDQSIFLFKIKPDTLERITISNPNFWKSVSCPAEDEVWFTGGAGIRFYDGDTIVFSSGNVCGYNSCIWFINSKLGWVSNDCYLQGYYEPLDSWVVIGELPEPSTATCSYGENHLWVTGFEGLLMYTHNANDFKRLENGQAEVNVVWETPAHPHGNVTFRSVSATSVHNVFVVGNDKVIMKYTEVSSIGDKIEALRFGIFPNPAKEKFHVQDVSEWFKVEEATLELFDLHGRKVLEKTIHAGTESMEIDVSTLEGGIYFCRLIAGNKSSTQKLLIQK